MSDPLASRDRRILKQLQKRALTLASKMDEFESLARGLSAQRSEVPHMADKMIELFAFYSQPLP